MHSFANRETSRKAILDYVNSDLTTPKTRIFLSHSHIDAQGFSREDLRALIAMLVTLSCNVYIDWLDPDMPSETSEVTANRIKEKIDACDRFLLVATNNAVNSRWVPWELGYADNAKGVNNIVVLPVADPYGQWEGAEYLRLYPRASISSTKRLAVFPPSSQNGRLIEDWMEYG